jgi:hypothetical protein
MAVVVLQLCEQSALLNDRPRATVPSPQVYFLRALKVRGLGVIFAFKKSRYLPKDILSETLLQRTGVVAQSWETRLPSACTDGFQFS